MVTPLVAQVLEKMLKTGFFDILGFVFSLAIFYAILRKSKVLGESPVISGVAALAISFFIFLYPLFYGVSLVQYLVPFFTHGFIWALMFLIGFLMASFFYPNLPGMLVEAFKRRTTLWVMLAIGLSVLITSGFITIFWRGLIPSGPTTSEKASGPPPNVIILATGLIIFVIILAIAAATVRMGE